MSMPGTGFERRLGALEEESGKTSFRVWAPRAKRVELVLVSRDRERLAMEPEESGYFAVSAAVAPGDRYVYRLDDARELPDPASRHQPDGVHGPSAVVDTRFSWNAREWVGLDARDAILYELHVGTFTPEGTFDAAVTRLDRLVDLGVTAIEVMPIAQFPGARNWGYDGVFPFAAHSSYGGPDAFRRFVDACHGSGLAVVLDVVYNHLGPEGNVLGEFAPYWSSRHRTPWGRAPAFGEENAEHVRRYFLENSLWWIDDCRVDGLRMDAVQEIHDDSPERIEAEMARRVTARAAELGRRVMFFPESHLLRPDLLASRDEGGCGHDAQWSDDLCQALHPQVGGETRAGHARFGTVTELASVLRDGTRSRPRGHRGHSYDGLEAGRFVVFSQNHDQVAIASGSARLAACASSEVLRLVAATVLHAPDLPLLFMGEEYGETAPFPFFTSHGDEALAQRVRVGRRRELRAEGYDSEVPDPQSAATFRRAILDDGRRLSEDGRRLLAWYRELIRLRRELPFLHRPERAAIAVETHASAIVLIRGASAIACLNFGGEPAEVRLPSGTWRPVADSDETRWGGRGGTHARIAGRVVLPPWKYLLARVDAATSDS